MPLSARAWSDGVSVKKFKTQLFCGRMLANMLLQMIIVLDAVLVLVLDSTESTSYGGCGILIGE